MISVLYGKYRIVSEKCDSENEMKERLLRCRNGFVYMIEPECHSCYTILKYQLFNDKEWFGIGIYSENELQYPILVANNDDSKLLLGHNNHITLYNLNNNQTVFYYALEGSVVFVEYYYNTIAVISELEAVQLKIDGRVLQRNYFKDILESYSLTENKVVCNTSADKLEFKLLK